MTPFRKLQHVSAWVISVIDIGGWFLVLLIWTAAYMDGGATTVPINRYGEAQAELLFWLLFVPLYAIGKHYDLETLWTARH